MKPTIQSRLENLDLRLEEISALLADPQVIGNQERFRALSREYAEVEPVVALYRNYRNAAQELESAQLMLAESDRELRAMAEDETGRLTPRLAALEQDLQKALLEYGVEGHVVTIDTGPVITMFELRVAAGVKLSQITSLANDIARALYAPSVRVVAPIPGKNTIGIEVPNHRAPKKWHHGLNWQERQRGT